MTWLEHSEGRGCVVDVDPLEANEALFHALVVELVGLVQIQDVSPETRLVVEKLRETARARVALVEAHA